VYISVARLLGKQEENDEAENDKVLSQQLKLFKGDRVI
jgi:hypothetical protein